MLDEKTKLNVAVQRGNDLYMKYKVNFLQIYNLVSERREELEENKKSLFLNRSETFSRILFKFEKVEIQQKWQDVQTFCDLNCWCRIDEDDEDEVDLSAVSFVCEEQRSKHFCCLSEEKRTSSVTSDLQLATPKGPAPQDGHACRSWLRFSNI